MQRKIEHPGVAFVVVVIVAALLSEYGITEGSLLLLDVFAVVGIYRLLTFRG